MEIEALLGILLLYIFPIIYMAKTKFKDDKQSIASSIISAFVLVTFAYGSFALYFYFLDLSFVFFSSFELPSFVIFLISIVLIGFGVFAYMITLIKIGSFLDKILDWKRTKK